MGWWLATPDLDARPSTWLKRFDPVYWTVDFPRPMLAAATTPDAHRLRIDATFLTRADLAGIIWESADRYDHALLRYATDRDYRHATLSFRWRSAGVLPLDAVNGPTLTIEGRDEAGLPTSWYVRLWRYADGSPADAHVTIDFGTVMGGWEADQPVFTGDVDRMFISLVAPGYDGTDAPLPGIVNGWVELSDIACDGSGSVLKLGDVAVPPHGLQIATGYDDAYNLTPARLVRQMHRLGYRGAINHYVGMSHYPRLERAGAGWYASLAGGAIADPCAAWHRAFAQSARDHDFGLIVSLSFELFDAHCWGDWKQRDAAGNPALTGYTPPSTLLSPSHAGAMGYLAAVARAFVQISVEAGHAPRFQVGEPWWWVKADGGLCLYDDAARAAFAPVAIADVGAPLDDAQRATLDRAGAALAAATAGIVAAVRADHANCERLVLIFVPGVFDPARPELIRANAPIGWAPPAFDVLQLEDYDWLTAGMDAKAATARAHALARFPYADRHYLAGFARDADDWPAIARGIDRADDPPFVWALPQVLRDGFTWFAEGAEAMAPFDDVEFPLAMGAGASVAPTFSTAVVTTVSGAEQRNADWASARLSYDVGPGVRSEADIATLIAFFRARRGQAVGFRFRDPVDHRAVGERLGTGDGLATAFALVRRYGVDGEVRRITRPVAGSVTVRVDGTQASGWSLAPGGIVQFTVPPVDGAVIDADFLFDVPVRFATDRLEIAPDRWRAGEIASVPLVEVREA